MKVLFFGGYLSTHADVVSWLVSARQQEPTIDFGAYHYPHNARSDDLSAIKGFGIANIIRLASEINNNKSDQTMIVGHSSGCAIANKLAEQVEQASLIALDGFRPSRDLMAKMPVTCWSAKSGSELSRNYDSLKSAPDFKVYDAPNCTGWSLHFSLVNKKVSHEIKITDGYKNCDANLCWLTNK